MVPKTQSPSMPQAFDGEIFQHVGKYARSAVLYAFENMGGPEALTTWASENPDEFYTKLFPKIIARESEVHHTRTVDQLMDVIDGDYVVEGEDVEDVVVFDRTDNGAQEPFVVKEFEGMDMVDFDD